MEVPRTHPQAGGGGALRKPGDPPPCSSRHPSCRHPGMEAGSVCFSTGKEIQCLSISETIGLAQTKGKQPYTASEYRSKREILLPGCDCWLSLPCCGPVFSVFVPVGQPVVAVASKELHTADSRLGMSCTQPRLALQTSALLIWFLIKLTSVGFLPVGLQCGPGYLRDCEEEQVIPHRHDQAAGQEGLVTSQRKVDQVSVPVAPPNSSHPAPILNLSSPAVEFLFPV